MRHSFPLNTLLLIKNNKFDISLYEKALTEVSSSTLLFAEDTLLSSFELLDRLHPDAIIMDVRAFRSVGKSFIKKIKHLNGCTLFIEGSPENDECFIIPDIPAYYFKRTTDPEKLKKIVKRVVTGEYPSSLISQLT